MTGTIEEQVNELLSLEDNPDEDFERYDRETLYSAVKIIPKMKEIVFQETGERIGEPQLLPNTRGSFDVFWREKGYQLLLNIKKTGEGSYWGQINSIQIKGELN